MLDALTPWGRESSRVDRLGDAAFGRNLDKRLPEDDFDIQPQRIDSGRCIFVADARIDNRQELAAKVAIDERGLSDAALLAQSWERWGLELFDHVEGDIALACWDRSRDLLTLARSAMSAKPLFYHAGSRFLAFASLPAGLHVVHSKSLDCNHAATLAGLFTYPDGSTIFAGIRSVRHGRAVQLGRGQEHHVRFWQPARQGPLRYGRDAEYGEHLLDLTQQAVAARLRRHHGTIASQLSAGRDSSAVTAVAADLLKPSNGKLIVLTAAPRQGFSGPALKGRLADESGLAAITAGRHANVEHIISRTRPFDVDERLRALHGLHYSPMLNPANLLWWEEMNRVAAERGVSVLLNGAAGNMGLSAGGADYLPDLLAERGWAAWLAAAVGHAGHSPGRWRNALNVSLGPHLPPGIYRSLLRATGRDGPLDLAVPALRPPYRALTEARLKELFGDPRPSRSGFQSRAELLARRDYPETINQAAWGVEYRDPTADRRLIDFCFSLPAEQLVSPQSARPVFDAAFRGLVPDEVLRNRLRGQQSADWFEHFHKHHIREALRGYGGNPFVAELLDLDYVLGLLDAWPEPGTRPLQISADVSTVLAAFSLANFIDLHFPR